MKISDIKEGDILSFWIDTGCRCAVLGYARVLRVGPKMVRVKDERGTEGWRYPHFFNNRLSDAARDEMRAEGSLSI